ncbi:MAG: hypothetical protein ACRD4S_05870 [Candidatus Acidiferrales bacterium]
MPDPAFFKKLYKILSWTSLVGLMLTLALVLKKSPPPNIPYDATAAARAEQKFEAADRAKAQGMTSEVALDPTELNSYLKQNLQLQDGTAPAAEPATAAAAAPPSGTEPQPDTSSDADPLANVAGADQPTLDQVQSSVKDVKVDMDGDLVKAYVVFDFHGKDLSLELDGHLSSQDGYIKFDPVGGKLGSLPLPQSTLEAAVEKMMNNPDNREKLRLPPGVSDIQVQNGQALVTYK